MSLLTLHDLNVLEALRQIAIVIHQRGVIFQHAAHHFEIVDASGERIGQRFENEERKRLRIVKLVRDGVAFAGGILVRDDGMLIGMRENIGDERKQADASDIVQRRGHQYGNDFSPTMARRSRRSSRAAAIVCLR